jgi:anaerobic magnesium-protoporphyrin IX monomethyl ester cyclase
MKVLFINPQQEMGGIQCLSAFLKRAGHETALVNDPNLFDNPWIQYPAISAIFEDTDHTLDQILSHKADLIALSVVTDDYKWALKWARRVKNLTNTPIVFGNVHPTFHPADVLKQDCVDFIIRGEGELTLLELVEALDGKRRLIDILGLGFKENGEPKINAMRPF